MARAIDAVYFREKLLEFRSKAVDKWGEESTVRIAGMVDLIVKRIDDTPAIDPESLRPRGRWIKVNGSYRYRCSNCDSIFPGWVHFFDYCPNCGAKMAEDKSNGNV